MKGGPDGYVTDGRERTGPAWGSDSDAEPEDGGQAGRGRLVVAGAPWAEAAEGLAAVRKCSGENKALILGNSNKTKETACLTAEIGLTSKRPH